MMCEPERLPLTLCADDYGIAPGVGRAIRDLAEAGRLTATSCMTVFPEWPDEAALLRRLDGRIEVGLHLTLTDQAPLAAMPRLAPAGRLPPLGRLIGLAHLGRLDPAEIAGEARRQLDAFIAAFGRAPDFIDGHQHVHLLPVVRAAVLTLFDGPLDARRCWLRSCAEPWHRIAGRGVDVRRAAVVAALARPLRRQAGRRGIAQNDSFRGVNGFPAGRTAAEVFPRFLAGPGARPLVMCHPGVADRVLAGRDPIAAAREDELRYLLSDGFAADLARAGRRLAPLPRAG